MDPVNGQPTYTSVEKLNLLIDAFAAAPADDPEMAQRQALFNMIAATGALERLVPNDPGELDHLLLRGARFALQLLSDDAWRPDTLESLLTYERPPEPLQAGEDRP